MAPRDRTVTVRVKVPHLTMAKEKSGKSRPQGQKSIASFFGGSNKKVKEPANNELASESANDTQADGDVSMPEDHLSDVDMDASTTNKKASKSSAPESSDYPPMNEIPAIFDDLLGRIPEIKQVVEHVAGRKLRVATMCSGTESPLLALELIQKSILEQHEVRLDIEHVFSCEIEPFKQAYIERNFHPPLLFRDVCELGDAEA